MADINSQTSPLHPVAPAPAGLNASSAAATLWTNPEKQHISVHNFSRFQNLSLQQIEERLQQKKKDPELVLLWQVIALMQETMDYMNKCGRAIPTDSKETLLHLFTRKSADTVLVRGETKDKNGESCLELLGLNLSISAKEDIPDYDDIPAEIKNGHNIVRAIRLCVKPESRIFGAYEPTASKLIDKMVSLNPGCRFIGKILVGPENIHPIWLEADKALRPRGFDDTEFASFHTFTYPDNEHVKVRFMWRFFPPASEEGKLALESHKSQFEKLAVWRQQRLAPATTTFELKGAKYACLSREQDAHALAAMLPGSFITEIRLPGIKPPPPSVERLRNLSSIERGAFSTNHNEKFDGFFDSSILPDLLPKGSQPKSEQRRLAIETLKALIKAQTSVTRCGGQIIFSETIAPELSEICELRLNKTDGKQEQRPPRNEEERLTRLSTADFFLEFLKYHPQENVTLIPSANSAILKAKVPAALISHFLLSLIWRKDLPQEATRVLCLLTLEDVKQTFEDCGLKVRAAYPRTDQWKNEYYHGHLSLYDIKGKPLPIPPLNGVVIGQSVANNEGALLSITKSEIVTQPEFLRTRCYRGPDGRTIETAERPNETLSVFPYFRHNGHYYIFSKNDYPRGITLSADPAIDGSKSSPYIAEAIAAIFPDEAFKNKGDLQKLVPFESVQELLETRAAIAPAQILSKDLELVRYNYPAPFIEEHGAQLINERVISGMVEITPRANAIQISNQYSGLASCGIVQPFEARQALMSCHCGNSSIPRLEHSIYELFLAKHEDPGLWTGNKIRFAAQHDPGLWKCSADELAPEANKDFFEEMPDAQPAKLEIVKSTVEESTITKQILKTRDFEHVRFNKNLGLSTNNATILLALSIKDGHQKEAIYISPSVYLSPVAQKHSGSANLVSSINIALPKGLLGIETVKEFVKKKVKDSLGLDSLSINQLGAKYYDSPGATASSTYPFILEVDAQSAKFSDRPWIRLEDALKKHQEFHCASLLTCIFRLAHACNPELFVNPR